MGTTVQRKEVILAPGYWEPSGLDGLPLAIEIKSIPGATLPAMLRMSSCTGPCGY
jgi:hypothetical protein